MSTLTAKDLRGNDAAELQSTIKKLQEDLFKNRMKSVTNQLENTMLLRHARRDIARVKTVLSEKARGAAPVVKAKAEVAPKAAASSKSPKAAPAGKSGKATRASGSKEK